MPVEAVLEEVDRILTALEHGQSKPAKTAEDLESICGRVQEDANVAWHAEIDASPSSKGGQFGKLLLGCIADLKAVSDDFESVTNEIRWLFERWRDTVKYETMEL